jgi:hypothetical protein
MSNAQKTPLIKSLDEIARDRARSAIFATGKALPASITAIRDNGGIVTVKFEMTNIPWTLPQIEVPLAGSMYVLPALTIGTKGVVFPADFAIGNMSGLGASTSDLTPQGSLSALTFFPIGNSGWSSRESNTQTIIWGPTGSILRSNNKTYRVVVTETGVNIVKDDGSVVSINLASAEIDITAPTVKITGNLQLNGIIQAIGGGTYAGNIHTTGTVTGDTDVIAAGKSGASHVHGGVTTGGGSTAPPT